MAGTRTNYTIAEAREILRPYGATISHRDGVYYVGLSHDNAPEIESTAIVTAIELGIALSDARR